MASQKNKNQNLVKSVHVQAEHDDDKPVNEIDTVVARQADMKPRRDFTSYTW